MHALNYCHNVKGVIHRDIKPDNIMINHNNQAVLIDFGVTSQIGSDVKIRDGTEIFFAPEMQKKRDERVIGANVDIWALGVTIFYMLTGRHPHHDCKDKEDLIRMLSNVPVDLSDIKKASTKDILSRMLMIDHTKRATL